jgi:hypothetical protein
MADETLARMFWGRVASDADRPRSGKTGRWQTLAGSRATACTPTRCPSRSSAPPT